MGVSGPSLLIESTDSMIIIIIIIIIILYIWIASVQRVYVGLAQARPNKNSLASQPLTPAGKGLVHFA